jgi:WD40 repeat protein/predicted Ser/Thr protein kinase
MAQDRPPDEISDSAGDSPQSDRAQAGDLQKTEVQPTAISGLQQSQVLGDRYRIENRLGSGGMGEVWRAFDLKLRVDVALKSLRPEFFSTERGRDLLRREVRTAREVISPNVCRVFDLVIEGGQELVSMEYVDGRTLMDLLKEKAPLDQREARDLAAQMLAGLEAIHEAGLVHRDMKPENVMITRTGRVVVMDFGIARVLTELQGATIAGTPAYMAPEQARGGEVDTRADIFSVGVILAEMISTKGPRDPEGRQALLESIRKNPPQLPESPWADVLHRAVAWDPEDRYPSTRVLARALEEVSLRGAADDEQSPYPGLSSFTEAEADFFFGREAEVEELWKKLQRLHLSAVMGPSGVGKSSFLRAGVMAAAPANWKCVICAPGASPFTSVAQSLVPEFAGDADAIHQLLTLSDPHSAAQVFGRWRHKHGHVLLIVDQFEELFTLNPESVQRQFTDLLKALAVDHDVHVLLSMRDDFLFRCHEMPALSPIFSELTPLGPLTGPTLRRALVQPSLACGYRFEDEALVNEMLEALHAERGALPLLAFAAARLWDQRDRQRGILERNAYREIGGVAGALARHAEATLERIGTERIGIVREIFRNLVTAQNTRAVQSIEELMSVFEDREQAEAVLQELIAARLLTSFEAPGTTGEENSSSSRVELIHESLLSAWPRLVRWQSQDADSARLRDQLRQAAQLWQERGKMEDLLWTGTAYQEFDLWREHYPGGLTSTEESFATAMHARVAAQRRRRRIAVSTGFAALVVVTVVIGLLGLRAERRGQELAANQLWTRAEKALTEPDPAERNNTDALAFATASLELRDAPALRRLALRALWQAPPYFVAEKHGRDPQNGSAFLPDGEWLATADGDSGVTLWPADGGTPRVLPGPLETEYLDLHPSGRLLCATTGEPFGVTMWSLETGRVERTWSFENMTSAFFGEDRLLTATLEPEETWVSRIWPLWHSWSLSSPGEPVVLGRADTTKRAQRNLSVDARGRWLVDAYENEVRRFDLDSLETAQAMVVDRHAVEVATTAISDNGRFVASRDVDSHMRVWSVESEPQLVFWGTGLLISAADHFISIESQGNFLAAPRLLWNLRWPHGSDGIKLPHPVLSYVGSLAFHPDGQWLAATNFFGGELAFYPLNAKYPWVLPGTMDPLIGVWDVAVSPAAGLIASAGQDEYVRLASLHRHPGEESPREVYRSPDGRSMFSVAFDAPGERLLVGGFTQKDVRVISTEGEILEVLEGLGAPITAVAFSPGGDVVVAAGSPGVGGTNTGTTLRVWNLRTEESYALESSHGQTIWEILFVSETEFLAAGGAGLELWSLPDGSARLLTETAMPQGRRGLDRSPDGRMIAYTGSSWLTLLDLESGDVRDLSKGSWPWRSERCALDPAGRFVAVTSGTSLLVKYLDQDEPHVLESSVPILTSFVDAESDRIITFHADGSIRGWPIPTGRPLFSLPRDEFLEVMRAQTNVGAVPHPDRPGAYRIEVVRPWEGWKTLPSWQ